MGVRRSEATHALAADLEPVELRLGLIAIAEQARDQARGGMVIDDTHHVAMSMEDPHGFVRRLVMEEIGAGSGLLDHRHEAAVTLVTELEVEPFAEAQDKVALLRLGFFEESTFESHPPSLPQLPRCRLGTLANVGREGKIF